MPRSLLPSTVVIRALRIAAGVAAAQTVASDRVALLAQAPPASASAVVQGVVLSDEPQSPPVPNARIVVFRGFAELPDIVWTNEAGRFSIPINTTTSPTLRVSRSGFITQFKERVGAGAEVEVRLVRAGVVTGHVVNERGDPVWGSTVQLRPDDPTQRAAQAASPLTTRTDDRGEFRFSSIRPGAYTVIVHRATSWIGLSPTEIVSMPSETPVNVVAGREASVTLAYGKGTTVEPLPSAVDVRSRVPLLSGRVLDQNGHALNGARVMASRDRAGIVSLSDSDAEGRYELRLGSAGSQRLLVTMPGGGSFEYGQRRSQEPGQTVTVGEKESRVLDIIVPAAGAISGRITDALGEPVEGLMVHPWEAQWIDGQVVVRSLRFTSTTDDRGRYRIAGLLPGTYYLGISDEVSNSHGPVNVASARVFYPGATSIATASPLTVDGGGELSGADVVLDPPIGTRVIGSVLLSTGDPAPAGQVRFFADTRRNGGPVLEPLLEALRGNGVFLFQDVAPGDYVAHVMVGRAQESLNEVGVATVSVSGHDTSFIVRTAPVSTLAGKVIFEGASPPSLSAVTISPVPADVHTSPMFPSSLQRVELRPDGTFEIAGLFGPKRIVAAAPAGWRLKSVMLDGRNLADEPMTFGTGDRTHTGAEIVFVRNNTALTGTARERDTPVMDYAVVVYPTDAALRYPRSPHMTLARSGPDGRYSVSNLPPGTYWVAAVDSVTGDASGGAWQSPGAIDRLISSARRVTLDVDRSISVDLPLIRFHASPISP